MSKRKMRIVDQSDVETEDMGGLGHNNPPQVGGIDAKRLMSIIERAEKLNEEKADILEVMRDLFNEAKGAGFDVKAIRECLKQRAMDAEKREEQEHITDLYRRAIGLIPTLDDVF